MTDIDHLDPLLRHCGSCRFHDVAGLYDFYRDAADGMGNLGFCRRLPPRPGPHSMERVQEHGNGTVIVSMRTDYFLFADWPETGEDDWCGEWQEDHRSDQERFGSVDDSVRGTNQERVLA